MGQFIFYMNSSGFERDQFVQAGLSRSFKGAVVIFSATGFIKKSGGREASAKKHIKLFLGYLTPSVAFLFPLLAKRTFKSS
jgi:hypothetical protein